MQPNWIGPQACVGHTFSMKHLSRLSVADALLLFLLTFTILWKGGKSLESTWLLVFVAGFCVLSYWEHHRRKKDNYTLGVSPLVWWSGVLFIVWTVCSFYFSTTRNYGFDEVIRDTALILLLYIIARRKPDDASRNHITGRHIVWLIAILSVLACEIGVAVYVFQPVNRFVGTFFDYRFTTDYWPNAWAEFLLLAWPAVLWRFNYAKIRFARIGWFLGLGFVFGCMLLSYSRGALLALFGQLFIFGAFALMAKQKEEHSFVAQLRHWFKKSAPIKGYVYLLIPVLAVSIFLIVNGLRSQFFAVQDVGQKITFTAAEGASSKTERSQFWRQAAHLSLEKPLFGWGPYSFRFLQPYKQEGILETADHPHNVFLKIAMERGYPALLLYLLFLGGILIPAGRRIIRRGTLLDTHTLSFIAVLGVLAHNLIDYNLQFVGVSLPLTFLLGILAASDRAYVFPQKKVVRVVEIVMACVLLIVTISEGRYLFLSSLGRHAESVGNTQAALTWYTAASHELFSRDLLLSQAELYAEIGDMTAAQKALRAYHLVNAWDYRWAKLAGLLAYENGDNARARELLTQAYAAGKYNDISIVKPLLQSSIALGKPAFTQDELEKLLSTYHTAIQNNAHYISLSPNVEAFIDLATYVADVYPDASLALVSEIDDVRNKAREARSQLSAHKPGLLW
ncbi:MAG: hypothetical protein JWM56_222 [Candidatus Peribacteria bacterium]|nr:hypothetical protein [Candidatus Peribacteria bacterium]